MNITEHIQKLSGYFKLFNVTDEITYVLVNFPDKWTVPNAIFDGRIKTTRGKNGKGYYFCADINEGTELAFEAAEYVVELNRTLEEKAKLLKEKLNELKELFMTEDLEKLKTLRFEFDDEWLSEKSTETYDGDDISKIGSDYIEAERENIKNSAEKEKTESIKEEKIVKKDEKLTRRRVGKRNPNDTSIMAMCKEMVND